MNKSDAKPTRKTMGGRRKLSFLKERTSESANSDSSQSDDDRTSLGHQIPHRVLYNLRSHKVMKPVRTGKNPVDRKKKRQKALERIINSSDISSDEPSIHKPILIKKEPLSTSTPDASTSKIPVTSTPSAEASAATSAHTTSPSHDDSLVTNSAQISMDLSSPDHNQQIIEESQIEQTPSSSASALSLMASNMLSPDTSLMSLEASGGLYTPE